VITFTPSYGFFLHTCEYNDIELVHSPLKFAGGHWDVDWDDFERKCADPKMKLVILCNPHNPTGRIWTEDELKRMGEIIAKNDLWVISDEIHCDLLRTGCKHIPLAKVMPDYKKLVTCMSASKTFNMAGLMHSHIIIRDDEERERFKARDKSVGDLNPLSLAAHKAAYGQGGEWLKQLREYLDGNFKLLKDFMDANYPECEFEIPDATYLAWVNFGKALPGEDDLCSFFANKAGVLLEGGDSLFVGNAEGWIRLNLAMPRSILEDGFARMKAAIDAAR
jgi:cystathionine beta-lyase